MDTILDGGSPRRGSLNSLHRQSSGSFSNTSRPAVNSQANSNNNTNNLNNLYKDLDKFTRYFIIKTVQVIVQSRIGGESKRIKTDCKPNGNDWFNINITDIAEVSERTKAALDSDGLSIKSNWRVCCEISLKTTDGASVVLEHWIITNKSNLNSSQNHLSSKLNNTTKSHHSCSRVGHLSTSNNSSSPLSAVNSSTTRVSPFSNKMRSRLNSINDCSGDSFAGNKLITGANNENFDIKSSTSCFSLATSSTNHPADNATTATITSSPSATSLSNNQIQGHLNTTTNSPTSLQTGSKTGAMSSIYTIYNRMSLLLKTLMTTTHIVPAYRLASRSSQTDSCVIFYRVYTSTSPYHAKSTNPISAKGSIEDISYNFNSESPNRRSSSSNSSFGSINIKDFVNLDELDHFCPILKLGSVKTDINELEISLCYRTDVKNSNHLMRSPRLRDNMYNRIMDEDCITAAKNLLAGNENSNRYQCCKNSDLVTNGAISGRGTCKNEALTYIDQPLRPAFAAKDLKAVDKNLQDPNLVIVEPAFDSLLQFNRSQNDNDDLLSLTADRPQKMKNQDQPIQSPQPAHAQSEPIQVPTGSKRLKNVETAPNLSSGSTPRSLTDSFVFVDLNPPFASEEQNDISSFFHGPSPAFSNGFDSLKDVDELTNQLADIEANASQLDEFVDNICISEDEEDQ